jgi:hypothetical protein
MRRAFDAILNAVVSQADVKACLVRVFAIAISKMTPLAMTGGSAWFISRDTQPARASTCPLFSLL